MGARTGILILVAAALLTFVGFGSHAEMPAILGLLLGGAGLATLIGAASRNQRQLPPPDDHRIESRLQQLEKRLQVTEDELTATSRELASLRETRDFDRQLYGSAKRAIPPSDPDRTGQS